MTSICRRRPALRGLGWVSCASGIFEDVVKADKGRDSSLDFFDAFGGGEGAIVFDWNVTAW